MKSQRRCLVVGLGLFALACGAESTSTSTHQDVARSSEGAGELPPGEPPAVEPIDDGPQPDEVDQTNQKSAVAAASAETLCERFPDGDPQCGGGTVAWGCEYLVYVPTACSYRLPWCTNCADWCCPEEIDGLPTFTASAIDAPAGDPPPGCSEVPSLNWVCVAEDKPSRGVVCPDDPGRPEGCIDSAYDDGDPNTSIFDKEPLYCCN
jgi:hypothetical protein